MRGWRPLVVGLFAGVGIAPAARAGTCEILAEGAPTQRLDCNRAALWAVRCKASPQGKRRVRLQVPEYDLDAEVRLPLATGERFQVTLLGPDGQGGNPAVDGLRPELSNQFVSALELCQRGRPPATLRVSVTEHETTGYAEQVDGEGVITRVPTYGAGTVVATAQAKIEPPRGNAPPAATTRAEAVEGKLTVRQGDDWVALSWRGDLQEVRSPGGAVRLLRLDFPAEAVEATLGPGEATALLAEDLVRWLTGDVQSRLGLVAFRRSGVPVPVAEVRTLAPLGPPGWRGADGGPVALRIGPRGDAVRVVVAFRPAPLDEAARASLEPLLTSPLVP